MKNKTKYFSIKLYSLFVLIFILAVIACKKDNDINIIDVGTEEVLLNASISGRIIDESEEALQGALITLKSSAEEKTVLTDQNGFFHFSNIENNEKSAFLKVEYNTKFDAFRRVSLVPNQNNYTEIKLLSPMASHTFSSEEGGDFSWSGAQVSFPAQGFVDKEGNLYSGNVISRMNWIDPSAEDLTQRMIGDLSGIDKEGNIKSLGTFGMIQVELTDESGNKLNLAEGSEAELVFPVPSSMQSNAPAVIPLWSFDEELGTWIEEGEATYANGVYTGNVSHFSAWNVDCKSDPIEITGKIELVPNNTTGNASFFQVYICGEKFGQKGGWLSEDGLFRFYNFPKDEIFDIKIMSSCGTTLYEETMGPFSSDTDLGVLNVEGMSDTFIIAQGNAIDCSGDALTSGYLLLETPFESHLYPLDSNGEFNVFLELCDEMSLELEVVNPVESQISITQILNNSQASWTFADIQVCGISNLISNGHFEYWFDETYNGAGGACPIFWHCTNVPTPNSIQKVLLPDNTYALRIQNKNYCQPENTSYYSTRGGVHLRTTFPTPSTSFNIAYNLEIDSVDAPATFSVLIKGSNQFDEMDSVYYEPYTDYIDTHIDHQVELTQIYDSLSIYLTVVGHSKPDSIPCDFGYLNAIIDNLEIY